MSIEFDENVYQGITTNCQLDGFIFREARTQNQKVYEVFNKRNFLYETSAACFMIVKTRID